MAALTCSSSTPEEDFHCPICWDIFQTPVTVINCHHMKCFLSAIKTMGAVCPLCHGPVTAKERTFPNRSTEKEDAMRKHLGKCKNCGKLKKYYVMRKHYKACSQKQDGVANKTNSKKKRKSRSRTLQVNEILQGEEPQQSDNVDVTEHQYIHSPGQ
ncbi:E3 ubiquitin-protein ligase RNF138-like isoform X2 [Ranitomeya variabilis]|uniref:E3 ubiquitin-protein ligase RNF138-like isoform X2 n=1 Tax=Ranitomeya variabilis TaxID=490064 RepID=UPI004057391C